MFTTRRKQAYEALHPETRHGGDRRSSSQPENLTPSFTQDTAAKTGQGASTVARDAARGVRIDEQVLAELAGTDLDTGRTLDALAAVPKEAQPAVLAGMQTAPRRVGLRITTAKQIHAVSAAHDHKAPATDLGRDVELDRREEALAAREAAVAARELLLDAEADRYTTEAGWRWRLFALWREGHPKWRAGAEAMFPAW